MCMICECERVCFGAHVLLLNNLRTLVNFGLRCGGFPLLRRFWMQLLASSINSNMTTLSGCTPPTSLLPSCRLSKNFAESTFGWSNSSGWYGDVCGTGYNDFDVTAAFQGIVKHGIFDYYRRCHILALDDALLLDARSVHDEVVSMTKRL